MNTPSPSSLRAAEAIKAAIRAACGPCGGTGREVFECEYCGRPMQAVDASIIDRELEAERAANAELLRAAKRLVATCSTSPARCRYDSTDFDATVAAIASVEKARTA